MRLAATLIGQKLLGLGGIGIDVAVSKKVAIGGEVKYTQYKDIKCRHPGLTILRFKPSELSITLNATYHF